VCISQVFSQIKFINNLNHYEEGPEIITELITFLFIRHMIIIPILVRIYTLGESIKYNHLHISRKFYDSNFQNEIDEHFKKIYSSTSNDKNWYQVKIFLIPTIFIFILSSILILIPFTNCSISEFFYSQYKYRQPECGGKVIDDDMAFTYELTGVIIINFYLVLEICSFLTFLFLIFRYPFNFDKFYLRLEFISLFLIWICSLNFVRGLTAMFNISYTIETAFITSSVRNGCIAILYSIVTHIRKNIKNEDIKSMMNDFDSFMFCHVSYSFFRDYIKNYSEEDYKFLSFWTEYHIFKQEAYSIQLLANDMLTSNKALKRRSVNTLSRVRTSSVRSNKSNDSKNSLNDEQKQIIIKEEQNLFDLASGIFMDYFLPNKSIKNQSLTFSTSNPLLYIEFPIDIYEKCEDTYKRNFRVENYIEVYDEAYNYVNNKLYNTFLNFLRDQSEYKKLERIIFFIDFYDIKRVNI
jgi:hypothetical protein